MATPKGNIHFYNNNKKEKFYVQNGIYLDFIVIKWD